MPLLYVNIVRDTCVPLTVAVEFRTNRNVETRSRSVVELFINNKNKAHTQVEEKRTASVQDQFKSAPTFHFLI